MFRVGHTFNCEVFTQFEAPCRKCFLIKNLKTVHVILEFRTEYDAKCFFFGSFQETLILVRLDYCEKRELQIHEYFLSLNGMF